MKIPENKEGKMTEEEIEVIYCYRRKEGEVIVKYLEEGTEKEIASEETIKGKVFDSYTSEAKEIEGYELTKIPDNKEGEIKEEKQEVKYYYRPLPFDISITKRIYKVLQNEKEIEGNIKNGKLVKIDIDGKKVEEENIKIIYAFKIKNEGQIAGSVGTIEDYIPEGLEFVKEDNAIYWEQEGDKIVNRLLEDTNLKPGEEKEITVALRWKKSGENTGTITNKVRIKNQTNKYGFKDVNPSNDASETEMLIAVKTGEKIIRYGLIIFGLCIVLGSLIYLKKRITFK